MPYIVLFKAMCNVDHVTNSVKFILLSTFKIKKLNQTWNVDKVEWKFFKFYEILHKWYDFSKTRFDKVFWGL